MSEIPVSWENPWQCFMLLILNFFLPPARVAKTSPHHSFYVMIWNAILFAFRKLHEPLGC